MCYFQKKINIFICQNVGAEYFRMIVEKDFVSVVESKSTRDVALLSLKYFLWEMKKNIEWLLYHRFGISIHTSPLQ
jgi:hypothetical protein